MKMKMKFVKRITLALLIAFCFLTCCAFAQEFTAAPFKDIEVVIEPSASEDVVVQVLYLVDIAGSETYNWHLPKDATSFVIEEGYMHTGKQYKIYMVAVNSFNIPSDSSNEKHLEILGFQIPEQRIPPKVQKPVSPAITGLR